MASPRKMITYVSDMAENDRATLGAILHEHIDAISEAWTHKILRMKGTSYYLRSTSFEDDEDTEGLRGSRHKTPRRSLVPIDQTVRRNNKALCAAYLSYISSRAPPRPDGGSAS